MTLVIRDLERFGPDGRERLDEAAARVYVRGLARRHRENFHVLSLLLPAELRDDFAAVYAFCRWADDLSDESGSPQKGRELLRWWREELRACFEGRPRHPVFVALHPTVRAHQLPPQPFEDLLDAFDQDQVVRRYATWEELLGYCARSANPVGRLVLMMCGHRDARRFELADRTCTALQLINFWQDVRRDILERDRVYMPSEEAATSGMDVEQLVAAVGSGKNPEPAQEAAFARVLESLVGRTQALFERGRELLPLVDRRIRPVLHLFTLGGEAILGKIVAGGYRTWERRPRLSRLERVMILGRAWWGRAAG